MRCVILVFDGTFKSKVLAMSVGPYSSSTTKRGLSTRSYGVSSNLKEVKDNNLSQGKTKQNIANMDVSSQLISEKPHLADSEMDLDPNELGCFSMVLEKGKRPYSFVEVVNASTQSQRVDVPIEV